MYVYNASLGRISHVGFVENILPGGYVKTVEGNTNTTGSASGDGVYRLTRKVTSRLYFVHPNYAAVVIPRPKPTPATGVKPGKGAAAPAVDKYGQPRTGGSPAYDSAHKQILELAWLVNAANMPATQVPAYKLWTQMAAACRSLKAMGLMAANAPMTGPVFKASWKRWQGQCGFKGKDADGKPGTQSFSRFIERTGRSKKSPGYQAK
jgi:hypothetical protein